MIRTFRTPAVFSQFRRSYRNLLVACTRQYSTVESSLRPTENVEIPCGSSGSITLNIIPPISGELFSPSIIFLPSGPILESAASDSQIITALSASSNCTIININYRTGTDIKWPVPLHDVFFGYDWLVQRLAKQHNAKSPFRRIGVCGQLLGGSLGMMLSLTECGPKPVVLESTRVVAAALNNPIVDWVVPDREALERQAARPRGLSNLIDEDYPVQRRKSKRSKKDSSWGEYRKSTLLSESNVLDLRNSLFSRKDAYFDPFASAIHFFRTPGMDVPLEVKQVPADQDPDSEPENPLRRKSPKVFPGSDSKVLLPSLRIATGETSILRSQNEELIERITAGELRRSLSPHRMTVAQYWALEGSQRLALDVLKDKAEKKFELSTLENTGLWGYGDENVWRPDVEAAGRWLKDALTA